VAAATLFFSLAELIEATPQIVENLERYDHLAPPKGRPTQLFTYRPALGSGPTVQRMTVQLRMIEVERSGAPIIRQLQRRVGQLS